jgi:hypothetical protein
MLLRKILDAGARGIEEANALRVVLIVRALKGEVAPKLTSDDNIGASPRSASFNFDRFCAVWINIAAETAFQSR